MDQIAQNWLRLEDLVDAAARRAGRDRGEIDVVAVSKTRTAAEIDAAIRAGLNHVGENKVQEAGAKKPQVEARATWHFVGHVQTNKAARVVELFDVVQSVDSARVAAVLDARAARAGRVLDVLIQVNTSGAPQQHGVDPDDALEVAAAAADLAHVRVRGLMTIAAFSDDEATVRHCFARLRELGERLAAAHVDMRCLSMGMSADFEWAIAEGANMIRLGTAIFGQRRN